MWQISRVIAGALFLTVLGSVRSAAADPISLGWPQSGGPGTDVVVTYSYSNLLDGTFLLAPSALRSATEEALGLWARYAPLHFVERPDSGPPPGEVSYPPGGTPLIRIGHHLTEDLAHAYYPTLSDGLGGDIHLDSGGAWNVDDGPWNFLEAITHELGHALGLTHELNRVAIMNPFFAQQRFFGLGHSFLLPADIEQLQGIYGAGTGSVTPLDPVPEPGTVFLVAVGLAALARRRLRGEHPGNRLACHDQRSRRRGSLPG